MSGTAIPQYSSEQMYATLLQHPSDIDIQSDTPWQPLSEFKLLETQEQDERIRDFALVNLGIFQEALQGKKIIGIKEVVQTASFPEYGSRIHHELEYCEDLRIL